MIMDNSYGPKKCCYDNLMYIRGLSGEYSWFKDEYLREYGSSLSNDVNVCSSGICPHIMAHPLVFNLKAHLKYKRSAL